MVAAISIRNRAMTEKSYLFLVVGSLCGATVTLFERLELKASCLCTYSRANYGLHTKMPE